MIDLDAIRGDIEMATRSAEMARHVALDHVPELLTEIERLTPREITTVEELELLPVGSVVYQSGSPLYGPQAWIRRHKGWQCNGDPVPSRTAILFAKAAYGDTLTVVYTSEGW